MLQPTFPASLPWPRSPALRIHQLPTSSSDADAIEPLDNDECKAISHEATSNASAAGARYSARFYKRIVRVSSGKRLRPAFTSQGTLVRVQCRHHNNGHWSAIQAGTDIVQHHRDGKSHADANHDGKTCGDGKQTDCFTNGDLPFISRDLEPIVSVRKPRPLKRASVFHLALLPQWLRRPAVRWRNRTKAACQPFPAPDVAYRTMASRGRWTSCRRRAGG